MNNSDVFGLTLFLGFGLWWILLPNGVIKFYTWFHKGEVELPQPIVIRIIGLLWFLLVAGIYWFSNPK